MSCGVRYSKAMSCQAWQSMAWRGFALRGSVGQGSARFGGVWYGNGDVLQCMVMLGFAS